MDMGRMHKLGPITNHLHVRLILSSSGQTHIPELVQSCGGFYACLRRKVQLHQRLEADP